MGDKVFCFVYGTIQPGYHNYRPGFSVGEEFPGTVAGHVYWSYGPGSYPVAKLVEFNETPKDDHVVHGTWTTVDTDSETFKAISRMEIGAGYRVLTVKDAVKGIIGIAYDYRGTRDSHDEIENGNWAEAMKKLEEEDLTNTG